MIYAFILVVGLIAGILGGIVGTGTSIMLLPVLAYSFGPKQAVPIMAIAAIMANMARIMAWWRDIDWRAVVVYSLPGIPAAALGAGTLLALPSGFVDIAIGAFFILMIPFRRWMHARQFTLPLWSLAVIGAAMGYLTGIVASTGPMTVPIFVSYGLIRRLARRLHQQGDHVPTPRCLASRHHFQRADCRIIALCRCLHRQACGHAHQRRELPSFDGSPDAGGRFVDVLECISWLRA